MADTLLIIEDESLLGNELKRHYGRAGWEVLLARSCAEAKRLLLEQGFEPLVVLTDMSLPDGNALDLLESIREHVTGEWLVLTGYGSVADSVRALRLGAFEFLEKPCPTERLDLVVAGAARSARAHRRLREQSAPQVARYRPEAFGGRSAAAERIRSLLWKRSKVPLSAVVLTGETGTGKGLSARILHHTGPRAAGPLVEVNCAALPGELLESELFGHEPGSFTGATRRRRGLIQQASGGTLFLDEISELPLELQAKLLRAIEDRVVRPVGSDAERKVDVQVIAATNRDLRERVRQGAFREDLMHRLSVFSLELPALRERIDDIEDLVPTFIAQVAAKAGKTVRHVPDRVWSALRAYSWPGNVRELRNVIERSVLLSDGDTLSEDWLQLSGADRSPTVEAGADRVCVPIDGTMTLDEMDRVIVARALELARNNVTQAARLLGTTRQTMRYRIQKHGLQGVDDEGDGGTDR